MWQDLLDVAKQLLLDVDHKSPTQAALRRSASTSYYALFSATSFLVANTIIGCNPTSEATVAWNRVFRSLDHGNLKNAAKEINLSKKAHKLKG